MLQEIVKVCLVLVLNEETSGRQYNIRVHCTIAICIPYGIMWSYMKLVLPNIVAKIHSLVSFYIANADSGKWKRLYEQDILK